MPGGGADLHLHSDRSDGTESPARLVEEAAREGLEAISLTDHDTLAGLEQAIEAGQRHGLRVLPGLELSGEFRGREVHLLGYAFDPGDPDLGARLDRYRREREERAERIVERLNRLGVPIRFRDVLRRAGGAALGRPHVAEALWREGFVGSFDEAFERYLGTTAPAFVARARFSLEEARGSIRGAGGVLILAHPHLNLSFGNIQALAREGIDGLEVRHPGLRPSQEEELRRLTEELGLLATGGSDSHGGRRGAVGTIRVPAETVDRIERAARDASRRRAEIPGGDPPRDGDAG
jgi:hypothetical protein